MSKSSVLVSLLLILISQQNAVVDAFQSSAPGLARNHAFIATATRTRHSVNGFLRMATEPESSSTTATSVEDDEVDPMEEAEMDAETRKMLEKQKRADELRAQEVFMKRSTGLHKCKNCDWEYDETKGDAMMIGGMIQPGTKFEELPSNWRCPVCRASKDNFEEIVEEIPGFEVNQGYGFGTNSWTAEQKNLAIFGGLGLFFLLFLSGYALS